MKRFSEKPGLDGEIERPRTIGVYEALPGLLQNIATFREALAEREQERLDRIIDPDRLGEFEALADDSGFFNPDKQEEKEKLFSWLEKLATAVESIVQTVEGSSPRGRFNDSVENLQTLGVSLSNIDQSLEPLFSHLEDQDLDDGEKARAGDLHKRLRADLHSRAKFVAERVKDTNEYISRQERLKGKAA